MKIKTQLFGLAGALFVLGLINTVPIYLKADKLKGSDNLINYSGLVRSASQRIAKLELAGRNTDPFIRNVDKFTLGLIHGDAELEIPLPTNPHFVETATGIKEAWITLKRSILEARHDSTKREDLLQESERFFELANAEVSEAARAGEHGRGFAVVAVEIRKLADESRKSIARINTLVEDIQKSTNSAVMVAEEGAKTVDHGAAIAEETSLAFDKLAKSIKTNFESTQQTMLNVQQQTEAVKQIAVAMESINAGARESAAGVSQTKAGVERLKQMAMRLQEIV
jgi:hypothetical protein